MVSTAMHARHRELRSSRWIVTASPAVGSSEIRGLDAGTADRDPGGRQPRRTRRAVGASSASLVAVVIGLHRASSAARAQVVLDRRVDGDDRAVLAGCTRCSARYAHLYYGVGGSAASTSRVAPDYRDFAYLAFTVGMTYQVSDTAITDPVVGRTLLRHALLSYLFGTAIIASTISVLAALVV